MEVVSMKKRFCLLALLFALLLGAGPAYAQTVTVQVPTFPVALNGVAYDNQHAKYPLLVYRDVTYFPMTYQLTRSMRLVTAWDAAKGLYIAQHTEETSGEPDMSGSNKLGGRYTATVANYPITVNGWAVDNSKEPYPLLNFRGVTYFPLSWQYADGEFGWELAWDASKGLRVNDYSDHGRSSVALLQMDGKSALFESIIEEYAVAKNENGDAVYSFTGSRYQNYRLDFAAGTLQKAGTKQEAHTWERCPNEDISAAFTLLENQLHYQGRAVLKNVPEAYSDHTRFVAKRYTAASASLLAVNLYYTEVPAPYTPYVNYVFLETKQGLQELTQWQENDVLSGFYETADAYYVCADSRNVTGRFYNGLHTILKIDKASGKETVLNDLYEPYKSLEAIGTANGRLYVRATYFGEGAQLHQVEYRDKVNPMRDGYFYIDSKDKLHKVHDYVDGEPFLAPNGKLYVYSTDRLRITNLTDHKRITFNAK